MKERNGREGSVRFCSERSVSRSLPHPMTGRQDEAGTQMTEIPSLPVLYPLTDEPGGEGALRDRSGVANVGGTTGGAMQVIDQDAVMSLSNY